MTAFALKQKSRRRGFEAHVLGVLVCPSPLVLQRSWGSTSLISLPEVLRPWNHRRTIILMRGFLTFLCTLNISSLFARKCSSCQNNVRLFYFRPNFCKHWNEYRHGWNRRISPGKFKTLKYVLCLITFKVTVLAYQHNDT